MLPILFAALLPTAMFLLYLGTGRDKRLLVVCLAWTVATGILAGYRFFENTKAMPPRMLLAIVPPLVYITWYVRRTPASRLQPAYLLAIHTLRLPVELILYQLYLQAKVPVLMTYRGWNFDILTGISAILLLLTGITRRSSAGAAALFRIWNIIGLVLLAIIVGIAVLSAPLPLQRLAFDQPNVALLFFPYTWLPAVVVPVVLLSHLLCLKRKVI
ncbi:hypothetical protein [Taibaiella koreensis]|uniref:hypothetical protein n=1 Tax=Taibaiella koreensis TaxID=1268548 RepID=UPI0013C2D7E6|nr:hypothetical protein [Taibaiella koreensis]